MITQQSIDEAKLQAFRTGEGLAWGEQAPELYPAIERLFRPGYAANLVQSWIPALDGVQERLQAGASVADVGCGYGASTILLAQAFPNSRFFDCLHDMGDPVGAIAHTAQALAPEGRVLLVEPMAAETIEGSVNPVAWLYSAGSTFLCTPNAIVTGDVAPVLPYVTACLALSLHCTAM